MSCWRGMCCWMMSWMRVVMVEMIMIIFWSSYEKGGSWCWGIWLVRRLLREGWCWGWLLRGWSLCLVIWWLGCCWWCCWGMWVNCIWLCWMSGCIMGGLVICIWSFWLRSRGVLGGRGWSRIILMSIGRGGILFEIMMCCCSWRGLRIRCCLWGNIWMWLGNVVVLMLVCRLSMCWFFLMIIGFWIMLIMFMCMWMSCWCSCCWWCISCWYGCVCWSIIFFWICWIIFFIFLSLGLVSWGSWLSWWIWGSCSCCWIWCWGSWGVLLCLICLRRMLRWRWMRLIWLRVFIGWWILWG